MEIRRVTRSGSTIYFSTESAGVKNLWRVTWFGVLRKFGEPAWVMPTIGYDPTHPASSRNPGWTPTFAMLEPYITREDRAALVAISIKLSRDSTFIED